MAAFRDNAPKVTWEVTETDATARDGAAIMKRVVGRMGDKADGPRMNLTVYLPAKASGPVPMLLSITFGFPPGGRGGNAAKTDKADAAKAQGTDESAAGRRSMRSASCSSRGWGYATLTYSDIQPDRANQWTSGVIGLTLKEGQTQPAPDEWGTISAWAWGISRAIDYLETDKTVNPKQIAITGVSRLGKTVLWASAQGRAGGGRVLGRLRRDGRGADSPRLGRNARRHGPEFSLAVCRQPAKVGRQVERPAGRSAHADRPLRPAARLCQRRPDRSVERSQGRIPLDGRPPGPCIDCSASAIWASPSCRRSTRRSPAAIWPSTITAAATRRCRPIGRRFSISPSGIFAQRRRRSNGNLAS